MPTAPASLSKLTYKPRSRVFPSPVDWRDQFFYQLLIDRFDDGQERPLFDASAPRQEGNAKQAGYFQGGTIRGITRRLDYIRGLGCTAIWISPPFKQRRDDPGSYHGYAIQDFLDVDPRFGTIADLRDLVRQAHKRGMYVICDIVINHAGDVFGYPEEPAPYRPEGQYDFGGWRCISKDGKLRRDDAVWPVELQDPNLFRRKGAIRDFAQADQAEIVEGDFFSLKDFNTADPRVLSAMIGIYKYWIAECDFDGFRIDTARHVEPPFLARFVNAIHEYALSIGKHDFVVFGEIIGDDQLLKKYVGNNGPALGTDEWFPHLDAVLDFPLYGVLDEIIKGEGNCGDLQARYEHLRQYYRNLGEAARYYITFIDNHDQSHRPGRRFLADRHGDERDALAILGIGYLLCNLGVPCMYYGTEQGFNGTGDSDHYIRESMFGGAWSGFGTQGSHFFDDQHPIYRGIARIAAIRREHPALRYGRQYFRDVSHDGQTFQGPGDNGCLLAMSRVLDRDEVLVVLNLTGSPQEAWVTVGAHLSPPGTKFHHALGDDGIIEAQRVAGDASALRLSLQPRQIRILTRVR